jgi:hydroxymethylpyrimidine pyrophosphatase-like HAD family hydrolase
MPLPWTKVILQQEHEPLIRAQRFLRERWDDRYEIIFSNPRLLELTAKGSNKGSAALFVADRLGVDRKNLY